MTTSLMRTTSLTAVSFREISLRPTSRTSSFRNSTLQQFSFSSFIFTSFSIKINLSQSSFPRNLALQQPASQSRSLRDCILQEAPFHKIFTKSSLNIFSQHSFWQIILQEPALTATSHSSNSLFNKASTQR